MVQLFYQQCDLQGISNLLYLSNKTMNGVIITGNTPKVSNVCLYDNITGHDLAKDLHHKGFYTNENRAVQAQTMTGGCKF